MNKKEQNPPNVAGILIKVELALMNWRINEEQDIGLAVVVKG